MSNMKKFQPGGFLGGQTFTLDDKFLKFQGAYKGAFTVPVSQIETVTTDQVKAGTSELKILGKGTVLASVQLPTPWAEKSMLWILENLGQK